ncbi:hypothetical protein KC963_04025 [Candidatus Saccharibacteria bacterium]|nr:hypothetical protein [Candidatus Saccharibacteria bacterium]MCA9337298.1 hypothetical protein [Candidatus Saccharibacteria bacterium]
MKRTRLTQVGDTIIEVMIAVAVLGTVIGGVYSVASRSLRSARQSQERSEALKYTESQIEQLKKLAIDNPAVFNANRVFCIDGTTVVQFGETSIPPLADDDFGVYPDGGQAGGSCIKDGLYHVAIQATPTGGGNGNGAFFTVVTRWDRFGGGRDEVKMLYRMYE